MIAHKFACLVLACVVAATSTACRSRDASTRLRGGFEKYRLVTRSRSADSVDLTDVSAIDRDSQGNVYVADRTNVVVMTPDLRPLRRIGREGKGPGEFGNVGNVRLLPRDSVLAFDPHASRVTVFAARSDHAAYTVDMSNAGGFFPYAVHRIADGGFVAVYRAAYGDTRQPGSQGARLETVRLLNPDASLRRDSVLAFPEYEAVSFDEGPMRGTVFPPWGRRMLLAVHGDRIYTAWSGEWKVEVHSVTGKLLATVHPAGTVQERPITQAEMDSLVQESAKGLPFSTAPIRRALEKAGKRTWPLLQDLQVDDAGTIWLAVTGMRGEGVHWIGVDDSGRRVAAFDVPDRVRIHLIHGRTAYGVQLDDDDVPHVVIYDLQPIHP